MHLTHNNGCTNLLNMLNIDKMDNAKMGLSYAKLGLSYAKLRYSRPAGIFMEK
jgi:hypothetical protein